MGNLTDNIISHLRLINFYRDIFPINRLLMQIPNIILNSSSFPLTINLLISEQCNFSCRICSWKGIGTVQRQNNAANLNIVDIENFISQIKKYHPLMHIGGGEPFMHKDLPEIVTIIKKNKLKCLITTNGSLMDEDAIDKMLKLKIDALIFSLYGLEKTHDIITGITGAFSKIMINLKYILGKRTKCTKVFVSSLPLPENVKELKQLVENLYSLGVDGIKIEQLNFLTYKEYAQSINDQVNLNLVPSIHIRNNYFNKEFITDLIELYKDMRETFRNFVYFKPYLNESQLINWYSATPERFSRCIFISHSLFVNYNGDIIPCQFFKGHILGNIRKDSLEFIWRSDKYKVLRENLNIVKPITCLRCCKN